MTSRKARSLLLIRAIAAVLMVASICNSAFANQFAIHSGDFLLIGGTHGDDTITVTGLGGGNVEVNMNGVQYSFQGANDWISMSGLDGDDTIQISGTFTCHTLNAQGDPGNDTFLFDSIITRGDVQIDDDRQWFSGGTESSGDENCTVFNSIIGGELRVFTGRNHNVTLVDNVMATTFTFSGSTDSTEELSVANCSFGTIILAPDTVFDIDGPSQKTSITLNNIEVSGLMRVGIDPDNSPTGVERSPRNTSFYSDLVSAGEFEFWGGEEDTEFKMLNGDIGWNASVQHTIPISSQAGDDNFYIEEVTFHLPLELTARDGTDYVELNSDVIVDGDLNVDTGANKGTILFAERITIVGDLKLRTGKSDDTVTVVDTSVEGSTSIVTSRGSDVVEWISSACVGNWTANLGFGSDALHVRFSTFFSSFDADGGRHWDFGFALDPNLDNTFFGLIFSSRFELGICRAARFECRHMKKL